MNGSIVRYILGTILKTEAILLLLPCLIAVIYQEREGFCYLLVAVFCGILGILITLRRPKNNVFYLKEGCVATSLSWILISLTGCLPFIMTGEIPSFTDALFETVSGFTTTGASILSDVEILSHCSIFWRSFTHWIGGMGVLVFILAVIPMSGGSNINLMRAESPGPSVGKLVPKIKSTARILYLIYLGMTLLEVLFLLCGKMPLFDALNIGFGTAGTGGFGIRNDSIAGYTPYIQWVVAIFMLLFGINFNAYYYIIYRKFKKAFFMEEVRYYIIIALTATAVIFFNLLGTSASVFRALTDSFFQVSSLITSTGFSTVDFDTWSSICKTTLLLLMFCGACAGSTGGGIKVSRIVIMIKTVIKELQSYIHPKSIKKINFEKKPVEHDVVRSINVYFITFVLILVTSIFLISIEGRDFVTNFSAVLTTLNNMGPGLSEVGPTCNFGIMTGFSKWVLMFDMLAGRLELFPLLILFHPGLWKGVLTQNVKNRVRSRKNS